MSLCDWKIEHAKKQNLWISVCVDHEADLTTGTDHSPLCSVLWLQKLIMLREITIENVASEGLSGDTTRES